MIEARSANGTLTAVSGKYGYLLKIAGIGAGGQLQRIQIVTRFEMNPRTLPALVAGVNQLAYRAGSAEQRWHIPVALDKFDRFARHAENVQYIAEQAQGFLAPRDAQPGEITFELAAAGDAPIRGIDAGGRFLDIRNREAPDKFTAEVRKTAYESNVPPAERTASLGWSVNPDGPYTEMWRYDPGLKWKDGIPIDRTLRWPEAFRQVRGLPEGTRRVYVRYRLRGVALDSVRLAAISPEAQRSPILEVTHLWHEGKQARSHIERISEPWREHEYVVRTGSAAIKNDALILYCPPVAGR
jgi:hypothetical protein